MNNENILHLAEKLAEAAIDIILRKGEDSLTIEFIDGFYKSDGNASIYQDVDNLILSTQYGQKDIINNITDIVKISKLWHERSLDRYDGWAIPPTHWQNLYNMLEENDRE